MKNNVFFRIVLWSIVIAVLAGILLWGTISPVYRMEPGEDTVTSSAEIIRGTTPYPIDPEDIYTVLEPLNVREKPTDQGGVVAILEEGTQLTLGAMDNIGGRKWAYITAPERGWVDMDYVQKQGSATEEPLATQPPVTEDHGSGYQRYPEGLREISIDWVVGDILIQSADVDKIEVREVNHNEDKVGNMVITTRSDSKLDIRYSDKSNWNVGINLDNTIKKDLYVTLPENFVLISLEVNAASSTLTAQNVFIQEVDFNGASGTCDFINCDLDELDLNTVSGDISFSGWLNELDCEGVSANVRAVFENTPRSIDMESMSGNLDITLPQDAGFRVTMDGVSKSFDSDFNYKTQGKNTYYCGSGGCRITMEAVSGNVYVHQSTGTTSGSVDSTICPEHGADCPNPGHHH